MLVSTRSQKTIKWPRRFPHFKVAIPTSGHRPLASCLVASPSCRPFCYAAARTSPPHSSLRHDNTSFNDRPARVIQRLNAFTLALPGNSRWPPLKPRKWPSFKPRSTRSEPFQVGGQLFDLFPKQPPAELRRFETMNLIWQLRHTAVHNVGIITRSDAVKLRLWAKENVDTPRILTPTRNDINYLKRFLDETASLCNQRIGDRLAPLLTAIYTPTLESPTPQAMADRVASIFRLPLHVGPAVGVVPPD